MPDDPILQALIEAVTADFEVFGELGRREDKSIAFLARSRVTRALAALVLSPGAEGTDEEYSLEVYEKLDARVPEVAQQCSMCHTALRPWARFCTRCGHDASGLSASGSMSPDDLRKLAERTAGNDYELLGEMPRSGGGGAVYFGRSRATSKVAALRLELRGGEQVAVSATQTLKTLETPQRVGPVSDTDAPRKAGRVSVVLNAMVGDETPPAPAAPIVKPVQHTLTGTEPKAGLTRAMALDVLGLTPLATDTEIRRRYEDLYSEYRVRETNAPTATLRGKYKASLASIEAAGVTLATAISGGKTAP